MRYLAPSSALVGNAAHLCELSSSTSSIAIFVDAIGPRIQASAILVARLDVVASVVGTEWRHI
jgi:hypothetical protein